LTGRPDSLDDVLPLRGNVHLVEPFAIGEDLGAVRVDVQKAVCEPVGVGVFGDEPDEFLLGDMADNTDVAIAGL
jgi:hypothetical protein